MYDKEEAFDENDLIKYKWFYNSNHELVSITQIKQAFFVESGGLKAFENAFEFTRYLSKLWNEKKIVQWIIGNPSYETLIQTGHFGEAAHLYRKEHGCDFQTAQYMIANMKRQMDESEA